MADRTLTADDFRELGEDLIENFDPDCVKGASYDFRAGEKVVVGRPDQERQIVESLEDTGSIPVDPGHAVAFMTYERVHISNDVRGRLSLRSTLANEKLLYSGGLVDPGYEGNLFITVFNFGYATVEIDYKQPLVSGEFVRIGETESRLDDDEDPVTSFPESMTPSVPPAGDSVDMRDLVEMNRDIDEHRAAIDDMQRTMERVRTESQQTRRFLNNFLFAAIAALIAGVTIQFLSTLL